MTGTEKVFFDTSPFIYLIEDHPEFALPVRDFMADQMTNLESQFFTSSITLAEFFVKPKKDQEHAIVEKFKSKLKEFHIVVFDISPEIAEYSAELRAKYNFLRTFDAIQLATAISFGCTIFFTNDQRLSVVSEIKILTVQNLIK
jgi:predicted nucleic acid-binding protein